MRGKNLGKKKNNNQKPNETKKKSHKEELKELEKKIEDGTVDRNDKNVRADWAVLSAMIQMEKENVSKDNMLRGPYLVSLALEYEEKFYDKYL